MGVGYYAGILLVFSLGMLAGIEIEWKDSHSTDSSVSTSAVDLLDEQTGTQTDSMAELVQRFEELAQEDLGENSDKPSPHDWVSMDNIRVYDNQVVIVLPHPQWAMYVDTNSMDPVIDSQANTIQLVPQNPSDIHVGDILAYESEYHEGIITHRVVEINEDENGWYAIMKGDNNPKNDPGRVRFEQIKRVVVAVIY